MAHNNYELRRDGEVLCRGTAPNLGYTKARITELYKAGYRLFKNGKVVKLCEV